MLWSFSRNWEPKKKILEGKIRSFEGLEVDGKVNPDFFSTFTFREVIFHSELWYYIYRRCEAVLLLAGQMLFWLEGGKITVRQRYLWVLRQASFNLRFVKLILRGGAGVRGNSRLHCRKWSIEKFHTDNIFLSLLDTKL